MVQEQVLEVDALDDRVHELWVREACEFVSRKRKRMNDEKWIAPKSKSHNEHSLRRLTSMMRTFQDAGQCSFPFSSTQHAPSSTSFGQGCWNGSGLCAPSMPALVVDRKSFYGWVCFMERGNRKQEKRAVPCHEQRKKVGINNARKHYPSGLLRAYCALKTYLRRPPPSTCRTFWQATHFRAPPHELFREIRESGA